MDAHPGLLSAYLIDGKGGAASVDWPAVQTWKSDDEPLWVHFDSELQETESWLRNNSGLDSFVVDGLLAPDARPRCDRHEDGFLLVLRGVNLHPGANPEDMVSIRIWFDKSRMISTRQRKLLAVDDIKQQFADGHGAETTTHLVARLAAQLTYRMGPTVDELSDNIAELEDKLLEGDISDTETLRTHRHDLIKYRRTSIALRRYIAPQREALNRLMLSANDWFTDKAKGRLIETVDRVTRLIEELDDIRERASIIQDELSSRISFRMERTVYVLTLISAIVLPVGMFTGLLGINVGGVPGVESDRAFWLVCIALGVLVAVEVWLFKRLKWL